MDRTELALILALLVVILVGLGYREYWGGLPEGEPVVIRPDPVPTPLPLWSPQRPPQSSPLADPISSVTPETIVNLNTATTVILTRELRISDPVAERILAYREQEGGVFTDPRQILEVQGVTTDMYRRFAHRLRLLSVQGQSSGAGRSSLNEATRMDLESVKGIGPAYATRILQAREADGGFTSWADVEAVRGVGPVRLGALKARFVLNATE